MIKREIGLVKYDIFDVLASFSAVSTFAGVMILGLIIGIGQSKGIVEKEAEDFVNNITIKEAPLLGVNKVVNNDTKAYDYFLKVDSNKNGIFDEGDVVLKTKQDFPFEKSKDVIYFENEKSKESAVIGYRTDDNSYIESDYMSSNKVLNKKIFEKFVEYVFDGQQR